jgi:hypothetical protein
MLSVLWQVLETLGLAMDNDIRQKMTRWLVRVKSKRGLALRDVIIVAKDESSARDRVQQMYLLSDISTICPSIEARGAVPPVSFKG